MAAWGLVAAAIAALASGAAFAAPADQLVALVNDYRSAPRTCQGRQLGASDPLQTVPALANLPAATGDGLQQALKRQGYLAARVQALTVTGPSDARSAFSFIVSRHCEALLDPGYAEIGVHRDGNRWRLVLAEPLLAPDLGDWQQAGREVLALVNDARAQPRSCGDRRFAAAPPVVWSAKLADAALLHSRDMARNDYFSHQGRDGSRVGDRATRAGYRWQRIGENIATGQGSPPQVVAGWLKSPGHCATIMNGAYAEMGAAYAIDRGSDTAIYWTQVFGTPR